MSPFKLQTNSLDKQMLCRMLSACPVGLGQIEKRRFRWINPAMVRMFGFADEQAIIGKPTRILYASQDEYEKINEALRTFSGTSEIEQDVEFIRGDGSLFHGYIRIGPTDSSGILNRSIVAITDRTPIKQAEASLMESERRFREILQSVRFVAVCLDKDGTITFCNDFLLTITGRDRGEVVGRKWSEIFAPQHEVESHRQWYEPPAWQEVQHSSERYILTSNRELRCIRWNSSILLKDGSHRGIGLACVGEDITDQKKANEILLRTERIKALGDMAGAVAHNFNNLLQIVLSACQVTLKHLEAGNTAGLKAEINKIVQGCDLGANTIKRLQDFSRVRNEPVVSDYAVFDLSHTLRQMIEMTRPWWKINPEKDGITISLHTDLSDGCFVNGKESELFEVAVNLMKNATEACSDGGSITVRLFADDEKVTFLVQDNGVGIDECDIGKIFQPFWTTKGFQGTGMGLSSSYGIVSRHGGEISVQSSSGQGAIFCVVLPRAHHKSDTKIKPNLVAPDVSHRILVIDDLPSLLETIGEGLSLYGHTVTAALSGKEALELFDKFTFDVVICDLGMEGMNGWEVSRALDDLCSLRGIPKPPFILLTGWGRQIQDPNAPKPTVDRVLCKPISIFTLLEAVNEIVDKNESRVSRQTGRQWLV